jgi:hypothetical protein
MRKVRVRANRVGSFIGMIMGGIFFLIGLTFFTKVGVFGLFWTFGALVAAIFNGYNAFSENGIATYTLIEEDEVVSTPKVFIPQTRFEENMRQINALKNDGLITEDEFQEKRKELMAERL